ncbi:IclR family transcriptional regulator [Streptomyces fuscigenes]|uniref:IclR family transcriptional regulator n=1 Tax=Streptomyces fuscigenes TaxID=1528880 RepID=UPI001F2B72DA|nr:helix-turn-helix domain-containing protein [Streptomyces fuscigenes]MCF3960145.1 helix-turn-helix domain-containing protein [Streptomyces fuscigenes]
MRTHDRQDRSHVTAPEASRANGPTRTVQRALRLLGEVCADGEGTLTECARRAEVPVSTALRLLRTLEGAGFVARRGGVFEAGPRLLQIGAQAVGRHGLARAAEPVLGDLVGLTGESAYLSVLGPGATAIYVAGMEGTRSIRHISWVGRSVPLVDTAVGLALTGAVPESGYVARRDRFEPDVTAVAAPIARPGGVAGAVSVLGPSFRMDDKSVQHYGVLVAGAAQSIAGTLAGAMPWRAGS